MKKIALLFMLIRKVPVMPFLKHAMRIHAALQKPSMAFEGFKKGITGTFRISILLLIMGFCFLSSGCAFHLRSKAMISSKLYHVYFLPEKPYSELSTQLNTLFRSLGLVLVKKESQACFSLVITNDLFSYSRPDVVDASLPATLNFLQTAHVSIQDTHTHKIVASQEFTVNHTLTLNANQIYTSDANDLIREKLNREIVSLIYYWLISSQTKESIHHANISSATRRAA